MVTFSHQVSCETSHHRSSQPHFSCVTFLPGITFKFGNISIVTVCTYPHLEASLYRLVRGVLFHRWPAFEGHHRLINSLFPMKPTVGTAGSQHSRYYGLNLVEPVRGGIWWEASIAWCRWERAIARYRWKRTIVSEVEKSQDGIEVIPGYSICNGMVPVYRWDLGSSSDREMAVYWYPSESKTPKTPISHLPTHQSTDLQQFSPSTCWA